MAPPPLTQSSGTAAKLTANRNVAPPPTKTGTPTTNTPEASTDVGRGGVSRSSSVGANGRAIARAEEIPGSNPPRYRVTLGINLGANVGAG